MKKVNWRFWGILALIGMTFFLLGCNGAGGGSAANDGKVIVSLTNHTGGSDNNLYAYVYASGEADTGLPENVIAFNSAAIAVSTASFTLEQAEPDGDFVIANGTQWIGSGGTSYDLYIYTDDAGNEPDIGGHGEQKTDPYPMTITINGDQTVEIDYANMVNYN